jgi:hypothetical protein
MRSIDADRPRELHCRKFGFGQSGIGFCRQLDDTAPACAVARQRQSVAVKIAGQLELDARPTSSTS